MDLSPLIPLPTWTVLFGFLFGAVVGSFLNVVIYRMPRAIPLGKPSKSFCPKCSHPLGVPDLFPLLSWLFAGRRCRYCGQPVSPRYFWVEAITGSIWAGIWAQYLLGAHPDPGKAIAYALVAAALVAIIFIDIELYLIPDQINAFLLFVGLGYNLWLYASGSPAAMLWGIPSSIAGALTGVGILWGIALFGRIAFRKDAMGHGDIKMARGVGSVLLPALAAVSFGLAVALGAVLGIAQILLRRGSAPLPPSSDSGLAGADLGAASRESQERESQEGESQLQEEEYEPESIGSLIKCGIGYFLCFDVIGLFVPKFYKAYFAEDPFAPPEDLETFEVERTMIPFGPYLALGAILAAVFEKELLAAVEAYLRGLAPPAALFWNTF